VARLSRGALHHTASRGVSRADLALAIALGVLSLQSASDGDGLKEPAWAVILLLQAAALPLALRSIRPLPVFAVTLTAAVGSQLLFESLPFLGPVIALYTVARHHERRVSLSAAGAALVLAVPPAARADENFLFAVGMVVVIAAAWAVGDGVRRRQAYLTGVQAREARMDEEQEERARQAVAEEQARIARELHDVISHNVSVMVLQAAAGRDVFATHPERSLEALGAIETAGREALAELRRLLDVVHATEGGEAAFAPAPRLSRLPALVEQVRTAGLDATLTVDGEERELPAGIDLSAYRIVQEALTNTLKHAHATSAQVELRYGELTLDVEILDDGRATGNGDGRGHGLIGMRERAALLGGRLVAGPRPGGGFSVRASIPLDRAVR
jgi:signal transduction histidine kinase